MFRKFLPCVGIVVGFLVCFLAVREFVADADVLPILGTLSLVLVASVFEAIPRHRQWRLTSRFERALTIRPLGTFRTVNNAHPF